MQRGFELSIYVSINGHLAHMTNMLTYANGTNVYFQHENADSLSRIVGNELAQNKLSLNVSKTKYMIIYI